MEEEREQSTSNRRGERSRVIFGVSGHRDLVPEDVPGLRDQLRQIFRRRMSEQPDATFELLTPLAEGADRVAAQEALKLGVDLVVPMPMTQQEYERDFVAPNSLGEFRQLLSEAGTKFELPAPGDCSAGNERDKLYAAVGDYIAQHSDVLILLWDGRDNQKVGGTSWVRMRREHWSELARKNGASNAFETIHVPTRRTTTTEG